MPADYSANEGDGFVAFMVELMGGVLANDVMVEFYTESGSAEGKLSKKVIFGSPLGSRSTQLFWLFDIILMLF